MKNTALTLLKDFGVLLGYTIIFILLAGLGQYAIFATSNWYYGYKPGGKETVTDSIFLKAAETAVLLTFFVYRQTLRLNYSRILKFKDNKLWYANRGLGFAALLIFFITGLMLAFGAVRLYFNSAYAVTEIELYFLLFILVGFNEEFLMRGIWVEYLRKKQSNFTAISISSGVFAALHLFNPSITLLSFANIVLAGVILAQLYLLTKNIWLATLFHLGWNFFQGPVMGFAVSGLPMHALFKQPGKPAEDVLNGGAFGLEGSVVTTVVLIIVAIALAKKLKSGPAKPLVVLNK